MKFSSPVNCCKRVVDATKLAYADKGNDSMTSHKVGSRDFWRISNSVFNEGKSAINSLFNGHEVFDKANLIAKIFSDNSKSDDSGNNLPASLSRIALKLQIISVTSKLVKTVITAD